MILEYHRPQTVEESLALLVRDTPTLAMGGGTVLNAPQRESYAVVDLQALGLGGIAARGRFLEVGATATLQQLADAAGVPAELREAVLKEATRNLRGQATVAGALVAADGRSPLAVLMLAADAQLTLLPGEEIVAYGQLLHMRAGAGTSLPTLPGRLITRIQVNAELRLAYEYVARSPADRPVVAAAAAAWPSGRLRIAIGGWGRQPRLALDAPEPGGALAAVESAAAEAGDQWASADYRRAAAVELAGRALKRIGMGE